MRTLFGWIVFVGLLVAPVAGSVAPWANALSLSVTTTGPSFTTGQTITVTAIVDNPGSATVADFYFGALLPDGESEVYFSFPLPAGRYSIPASKVPVVRGVDLWARFTGAPFANPL